MDPNATLIALLDALEGGDRFSASMLLGDLSNWIDGGGVLPNVNRHDAPSPIFYIGDPV